MRIKKTGIIANPMKPEDLMKHIMVGVEKLAINWENSVKEIISDKAVDTGEFVNSIWTETFSNKKKVGFIGHDGVSYGIFWEKGTKLHWVPFYRYGNVSEPILADWGHRVLGLSEEEMLKMGGMKVSIPALMPFLKSLLYVQGMTLETFEDLEKQFKRKIKHGTY